MEATITSKGQITLPKSIRDQLHLSAGDRVIFVTEDDGSIHLIPKHGSVKELKGILPQPEKPVTLEKMDRAIEKGASGQ